MQARAVEEGQLVALVGRIRRGARGGLSGRVPDEAVAAPSSNRGSQPSPGGSRQARRSSPARPGARSAPWAGRAQMGRRSSTSSPPRSGADGVHLTPKGYAYLGERLAKNLNGRAWGAQTPCNVAAKRGSPSRLVASAYNRRSPRQRGHQPLRARNVSRAAGGAEAAAAGQQRPRRRDRAVSPRGPRRGRDQQQESRHAGARRRGQPQARHRDRVRAAGGREPAGAPAQGRADDAGGHPPARFASAGSPTRTRSTSSTAISSRRTSSSRSAPTGPFA